MDVLGDFKSNMTRESQERIIDPHNETGEEFVLHRDLGKTIERFMALLPEEQRTAIILKKFHGLTFREIAELQECPVSTVKTRVYQGLRFLRTEIEQIGVHSPPVLLSRSQPFYPRIVRGKQ